ncbi:efflux RND transporter periplasmic adaptor subunit [Legionella dresdenensis]|uniref:Efflux RND transporter periplasmic adaptor subunit n=1 Tax=Legionella dresdenensis TaxID=450200 RepID=A0ABV8CH97_9GAMM
MQLNKQSLTIILALFMLSAGHAHESGQIQLTDEAVTRNQIKIEQAQSATIRRVLDVVGKIRVNTDNAAVIFPRYYGIIKSMTKNLGDSVVKGEAIAVVESNESLQSYTIYSPIAGTVVKKQAIAGELAKGDKPIYQIANLDTVWADLTVYRKEANLVKKGMAVTINADAGGTEARSVISYISPLGIEDSQTILARAILTNPTGEWLPGMYISGTILLAENNVPVAVRPDAIQQLQDKTVVFVRKGQQFIPTPVTLGEQDAKWIEVKSGLNAGDSYAAENSFLLKADLGKNQIEHD